MTDPVASRRVARAPLAVAATLAVLTAACVTGTPGGSSAPTATARANAAIGTPDRPIAMLLMPTSDTARARASGKAMAAALEKATGLRWDATLPASSSVAIEGLCGGQMDVAWLTPLAAALALQKNCGEVALAALRTDDTGKSSTTFNGQILVRTDSGIADLKGLKGKRFALVEPSSTFGGLFPLLLVKQRTGEDPQTFFAQTVYTGASERAVLALYQGQVDGAASTIDARDALVGTFPDVKARTTRIETVGPIPNEAIVLRRGLTQDLRRRIAAALVDHAKAPEGESLRSLYGIEGLDAQDGKAYDAVRDAAGIAAIDLEANARRTPAPLQTARPSPGRSP